jgi:hypothetical protein
VCRLRPGPARASVHAEPGGLEQAGGLVRRASHGLLRDLQGVRPIGSIAVVGTRVGGLNGLRLGIVEAPMLREPLPKLDSDLDADGRRCDDHTEWPAGLGCTGLAFDQLELDRE